MCFSSPTQRTPSSNIGVPWWRSMTLACNRTRTLLSLLFLLTRVSSSCTTPSCWALYSQTTLAPPSGLGVMCVARSRGFAVVRSAGERETSFPSVGTCGKEKMISYLWWLLKNPTLTRYAPSGSGRAVMTLSWSFSSQLLLMGASSSSSGKRTPPFEVELFLPVAMST